MEDYSEQDHGGFSCSTEEPKISASCCPEFPLSLLESGQPCQVHPDLNKIIQVREGSKHAVSRGQRGSVSHSQSPFSLGRRSSWKSGVCILSQCCRILIISSTVRPVPRKRCVGGLGSLCLAWPQCPGGWTSELGSAKEGSAICLSPGLPCGRPLSPRGAGAACPAAQPFD